jgi:pimeloyl-ACP methyl ester carboxylesterase
MLVHGDFATFVTNFAPTLGNPASPAPGLAPYLAAQNIDVWGLDRRWTLPAPDGDVSDFAGMTAAQDLDDLRTALGLARIVRGSDERLALVGFSHGAELTYLYASVEATRPASQRHVGAIVPLDWYGAIAPQDEDIRAQWCDISAGEYEAVAEGFTDSTNDFDIAVGQLAASAPNDPSPFNPARTNRQVMLRFAGQTYAFGLLPPYHFMSPIIGDDGLPSGLRVSSEAAAEAWFAGAPFHESMIEGGDLDAQLCGDGTTPIDAPLSRGTCSSSPRTRRGSSRAV